MKPWTRCWLLACVALALAGCWGAKPRRSESAVRELARKAVAEKGLDLESFGKPKLTFVENDKVWFLYGEGTGACTNRSLSVVVDDDTGKARVEISEPPPAAPAP